MADDVKPAWELEQEAHAINAADWQPLPGRVKKRCAVMPPALSRV